MGVDPAVDPTFTKKKLGIVEQEITADPFFTPIEIVRLRRGLFGLKPDFLGLDIDKALVHPLKTKRRDVGVFDVFFGFGVGEGGVQAHRTMSPCKVISFVRSICPELISAAR